jgi:hypothetical protein
MYRAIFLAVLIIFSAACACSNGDNGCKSKCDPPDWGYTYQSAEFAPSEAPCTVKAFHEKLIPLMEARWSHESAYIYENACELYCAAKKVPGSLKCACDTQKKHFNNAARDLVSDCARLKEIAYGAPASVIYKQVQTIEDDFVRICNLSER